MDSKEQEMTPDEFKLHATQLRQAWACGDISEAEFERKAKQAHQQITPEEWQEILTWLRVVER